MQKYISINKYKIPYSFEIVLEGSTYQFDVNYNSYGDFFTLDLFKDHVLVRSGEKIVYGVPLFDNLQYLEVPFTVLLPYDTTGEAKRITYENMNEDVFLYVLD